MGGACKVAPAKLGATAREYSIGRPSGQRGVPGLALPEVPLDTGAPNGENRRIGAIERRCNAVPAVRVKGGAGRAPGMRGLPQADCR
jgi:hypothetical protein